MPQEIAVALSTCASADGDDTGPCDALRRRLVIAISAAVEKLTDEAIGERVIQHELELRACISLARLAPALLRSAAAEQRKNDTPILPPDLPPEEAYRLLAELDRCRQL